jgi:hypothetical protein
MALCRATEFDVFLFEPIGEEKNGMLLSVVSALARLDRGPWREAAELTRMPKETAKQRLTSLIEALPNRPWTGPEPGSHLDAQGVEQSVAIAKVDVQTVQGGFRASKVISDSVFNDANQSIGKIDDLLVTRDGKEPYVVL